MPIEAVFPTSRLISVSGPALESVQGMRPGFCLLIILCGLILPSARTVSAQTIQPVILEYSEKADGKFEVTNDTLVPMAIVLEPKSFSITQDGQGDFRTLDADIHVRLSTTSLRLEPKQSAYVFYRAKADRLPAWFTIYAGFSAIQPHTGMSVRVMLPHTVYLYQKKPLTKDSIHVADISYSPKNQSIICDVENAGPALVRVQQVTAVAGRKSVDLAGFPLLPGSSRHLSLDWKENTAPEFLVIHFPHFDLKQPLKSKDP